MEAVRCTWTSAHDVSFITGCHCSQGRRTSSQVALLNVPLPRFTQPDWNDWALRFSRNSEKTEMFALWSGIQGAFYGKKKKKKAHWCLVWLQLPTYIIFFLWCLHEVITGLHVQHRMHITQSRHVQLPVLDANDLQDSGLILRAYVRVCVFSNETTEQLLKLDNRLEPIDGATFIF